MDFFSTHIFIFVLFQVVSGISNEEKSAEKYINVEDAEKYRQEMSKKAPGFGKDWVVMADGDDQPQIAVLRHGSNAKFMGFFEDTNGRDDAEEPKNISEQVNFRLFTRRNRKKGHPISVNKPNSLTAGNYDGAKPTKFVIHGWESSGDSNTVVNIKDAYLERSDVNVIAVDWSDISTNYNYFTPAGMTGDVGQEVAQMVEMMVTTKGARYQDFHLIGHSLGAHVAGAAGSKTKSKVSRVTGLDPALPGFQYWADDNGRLDKSDGEFVQVIHTCSGALGVSSLAGHADFYPNGGSPFQPGCGTIDEVTAACSHGRAHEYFAESIKSSVPFEAAQCSTWENFKRGACRGGTVIMGEPTPPTTKGVFYLMTNSSRPYALGPGGSKYIEYTDY